MNEKEKQHIVAETGAFFDSGCHCSEAVLLGAGGNLLGELHPQVVRLATPFAGGVGSTNLELCGACTGALMVIGGLHGRAQAGADDARCQELAAAYRAAFLQVKEAPYIEAARTYGASNPRIVFNYLIPRILPTIIPQLVVLIPSFVFLEATLAIFNVFDPRYPTWGKVIYEALSSGAWWGGSRFWVLEPITLLLMAGLGFALLGFALERILNPRLLER